MEGRLFAFGEAPGGDRPRPAEAARYARELPEGAQKILFI
jgi:hypothetical protein